ncbi:MAG: hypothetical protein E6149_00315 [Peptoniphilus harei]|nr:hypothetical protein [Peptoniphilus harei]
MTRFRKDPADWENKKMTTPSVGGDFMLEPLKGKNLIGLYRDYDVFFAHWIAINRLGKLEDALTLRKQEEWHEDMGACLWFSGKENVEPPFYVGGLLDTDFPYDRAKYFVQIPMIFEVEE